MLDVVVLVSWVFGICEFWNVCYVWKYMCSSVSIFFYVMVEFNNWFKLNII